MGFLNGRILWRWLCATAVALLLKGCAVPSPETRSASTAAWAAVQGWQPLLLPGVSFDIQAFAPVGLQSVSRLTIYIEGDGLAWVDRHTPSFAPTPVDPMGLRLAVADAGARSVYLARPCQYTLGPTFKGCHPRYWGSHRFAPEVIAAMDDAVDQLKSRYRASELVLVGYSGGAAVVALLAARRSDVVMLVTVAGTLDTDRWAQSQRVSPLEGSLNPRRVAQRLRHLPQRHFMGEKDDVVPSAVSTGFLEESLGLEAGATRSPFVHLMPGFDHSCCWVQAWPTLSRWFSRTEAGH